jgi:hypothetical protein
MEFFSHSIEQGHVFLEEQSNSTYGKITIINKSIGISGNNILKHPNRVNV